MPELESALFGSDFRGSQGEHLENLDLEVTIEGPVKVAPVRQVSICTLKFYLVASS